MSDRTLNVKNDRVAELERENARLAATIDAMCAIVFDPISDYYGEIRIKFDAILSRSTPTTEAVKLDPGPWLCIGCDERYDSPSVEIPRGHKTAFSPRPGYSLNLSDYAAKLPEKGEN